MIPIYQPNVTKYTASAIDAIQSGWISNHGEYVEKATTLLKSIVGVKHCILMANGTCATHCLFLALKYKHPTISKIYVPNNCYVAAHNAALMEYEKPMLQVMRMDADTWNIDVREEVIMGLDSNSAILVVHNLGNIVNVPRLKRLRPDLIFVEDACEGLFGKYEGVFAGMSDNTLCSSASFYGNKIITSGEGGAFFTNDNDVYNYVKSVYSQGMSTTRYLHNTHAYNYRMTNVQAAFLCDQFSDLASILGQKRAAFESYTTLLSDLIQSGKVALFRREDSTESADWIFAIRIVDNERSIEETFLHFQEAGVDIRPFFYPIWSHSHLADVGSHANDCVPELLNREVIMIPSSPTITTEEQRRVVEVIAKFAS